LARCSEAIIAAGVKSNAKMGVGKSLVGEGNEVAHIDMIIGPRGSAAEKAFANALVNNQDRVTTLLAVIAPNLLVKPNTILFNKVTIKNAKQAVRCLVPPNMALRKPSRNYIRKGVIPLQAADDLFICVGVFIRRTPMMIRKSGYDYTSNKGSHRARDEGDPTAQSVFHARVSAKHTWLRTQQ